MNENKHHLRRKKDQGIRSEMAPKLVWYSKQNMQHGVSQNLWDLCQVSFCFTPTGDDECICMRRWRTLVELQFVKKKEKKQTKP